MVLSLRRLLLCTPVLVAEEFKRPRERVVTQVLVKEREPVMLVCLQRSFGCEDNVFFVDFSVNIEKPRRLQVKSIITSI